MKIEEGRSAIPFTGFIALARIIFRYEPVGSKGTWEWMWFGWPFFIFLWNLMARSHSVGNIMLQHIRWADDSLIVRLPKHKGDQEGDRALLVDRHVYANPIEPVVCPILSLAVLTYCKGFRQVGGRQQVFEGHRTENKFSEVMGVILKGLSESQKLQLGANIKDIGTHTPRKSSTTYACGLVDGPSAVMVFLRAAWSLGNVKDRYLFSG
jgi:hypothetical protein